MRLPSILAFLALGLPTAAAASETVTYGYDAKGRLTQVVHSGGREDGEKSTYTFDAADNRTATQVSGARAPVVIVPLGGFRIIPLR